MSRKYLALVGVLIVLALGVKLAVGNAAQAATPPQPSYLTIMFGRSTWQITKGPTCTPIPGGVTMDTVAAGLKSRGLTGVTGVVTSRTNQSDRQCAVYTTYASWDDLANLRDNYGWTIVSQSADYLDMTTLTPDQQIQQSCGTLPIFAAHGFNRAWGLFAYPNNKQDVASQQSVTSCFAFGRKYNGSINTPAGASVFPYTLHTRSVNGGMCNDAALPCYSMTVQAGRRYALPASLAATMSPKAGQYASIQFYRFVSGAQPKLWDCTSANPADHWTFQDETYCLNDFYAAVDARTPGAIVTDPATVAQAWNINPAAWPK